MFTCRCWVYLRFPCGWFWKGSTTICACSPTLARPSKPRASSRATRYKGTVKTQWLSETGLNPTDHPFLDCHLSFRCWALAILCCRQTQGCSIRCLGVGHHQTQGCSLRCLGIGNSLPLSDKDVSLDVRIGSSLSSSDTRMFP